MVKRISKAQREWAQIGDTMAEQNWLHQLTKSREDKWIGGVCGGLGKVTPLPSWTWRLLFCLVTFFFGTGILIYILLWIFVPKAKQEEQEG
jgi:phage shock protein PspC (stress-responsive transcriptional regulator)